VLTGCEDKGFQKPLSSHPVNTGYCSYNNTVINRKAVSEIESVWFNNRGVSGVIIFVYYLETLIGSKRVM
jgi:ABC-type cobalt transport system substrate-binding protein